MKPPVPQGFNLDPWENKNHHENHQDLLTKDFECLHPAIDLARALVWMRWRGAIRMSFQGNCCHSSALQQPSNRRAGSMERTRKAIVYDILEVNEITNSFIKGVLTFIPFYPPNESSVNSQLFPTLDHDEARAPAFT